ncbi:MAG: hypothetical protein Q4C87_06185 [Actinomycetaceae bacterium]|nr:hypothetical protein [Actinomycetaceae bacterium]
MSSRRNVTVPLIQLWRPVKDEASFWQGRVMINLRRVICGLLICVIPLGIFGFVGDQFFDNYGQGGLYALLSFGALFLSLGLLSVIGALGVLFWPLRKSLEKDRAARETPVQIEPQREQKNTGLIEGIVNLWVLVKRIGLAVLVTVMMVGGLIFGTQIAGSVVLDLFHGPQVVHGATCVDVETEEGKTNSGRRNPFPRKPYVKHTFTLQVPDREEVILRARVIQDRSDRTIPEKILTSCTLSTPFTLTYYPHSSVLVNAE